MVAIRGATGLGKIGALRGGRSLPLGVGAQPDDSPLDASALVTAPRVVACGFSEPSLGDECLFGSNVFCLA